MNLPIRTLLIAGLTALCIAGYTKKAVPHVTTVPANPSKPALKMATLPRPMDGTLYYWYSWPYDEYNDRKTVADECYEMWLYYAAWVDTDPSGGVPIERGYYTGSYPHDMLPSYWLYVHYVYQAQ